MRFIKEIQAVGLKDWIWYTFVLQRNVLHWSLDVDHWYRGYDMEWMHNLALARRKANEIDNIIRNINHETN